MTNNQIKFILEDEIVNSLSKDSIQASTGDRYIRKSIGGEEIVLTIIIGLVTNGIYDIVKSKVLNAIIFFRQIIVLVSVPLAVGC